MSSLMDLINQFISEHGSVEIQEKRISQIKELAALLEKKLTFCESESRVLKTENQALKTEKVNLQKDNAQLKIKLDTIEKASHISPTDEQMSILSLLIDGSLNIDKIIEATERKRESVIFDIEVLRADGLIEVERFTEFSFCSLTQEGRKFLKEKGLLM